MSLSPQFLSVQSLYVSWGLKVTKWLLYFYVLIKKNAARNNCLTLWFIGKAVYLGY
jgi:hypothetical protein